MATLRSRLYVVPMLRYDLQLYRRGDGALSPKQFSEHFEFDAEDDKAAVVHAVSLYADELAACRYAMISSVGGRMIWRKPRVA